jgi:alkylation response protein AidB-like acyl-CoA dehydrogenase
MREVSVVDYRFTPEQEAFRSEIRAFVEEHLDGGDGGALGFDWESDELWKRGVEFSRALSRRGWFTPHWSPEYGGAGMSVMEQVVLREELAYHRAPIINSNGVNMLGPVLMIHGTEEQKAKHLPSIAACATIWSQGFSEPGAGSDLASLQMRATRDGDAYVINGQKIWTSTAHRAQWMFLLARTNPEAAKHRGISMFLVDLKTPGLTVRPILGMGGRPTFNEEFFEDVRVPAQNLVGSEDQGWYIATTVLDFERSDVASSAGARRDLVEVVEVLQRQSGKPPAGHAAARIEVAQLVIAAEAGRYLSYRVASIQQRGGVPNYEASMAKLFHSELRQRIADLAVRAQGLAGARTDVARFADSYMTATTLTVAAGTSEIQRNIIATRGLGLPRA